ncbi:MAG: DUF2312 domain-containing protein [Alphaproteobacteria bacterium]|jgi:uncharacterized protein (UPF0335 family)|nr:DUF2312 domain-containing protein [Alphaproteobacteria bacterium]MBX9786605.1 DUF2312 domain-containing protein [Alphaproteobacteria bacterium]
MSQVGGVSSAQLKSFIERIERLEEEKAAVAEQIREVFGEAKGMGFDIKIIRQVIKIRKMETQERLEQEELLDLYLSALGMGATPPSEAELAAA